MEQPKSVRQLKEEKKQRLAAMSAEERLQIEAAEKAESDRWALLSKVVPPLHKQFKGCPIWDKAYVPYAIFGYPDPLIEVRKSWQASILQDESESKRWEIASDVAPIQTSCLLEFLNKEPALPPPPTNKELLEQIRASKLKRSWSEIAAGAGVPHQWLKKLVTQGIKGRTNKKHMAKLLEFINKKDTFVDRIERSNKKHSARQLIQVNKQP